MNKNLSLFCEKFNVPEALHNSIPKILNEEEMIILNHLADKEEKLSDLISKFLASGKSLIESLHKRGYLIRISKGEKNYYRSNTVEQIIKRFVNHNPKYLEFPEEEKKHFQEWVMGISLEEMKASEKPEYRVIPIEKTIEDKRQLIPHHQAIHYLQESAEITLIDCLCRNINNKEDPEYLCNCCECCCFFVQALKKRGILTSMGKSGYTASLSIELCNQCGICIDNCIFEAISDDGESIIFDEEKCFGCGLCAYNCPQKAIKLVLNENENR